MADFTPDIAADIVAACQSEAAEIGNILTGALGTTISFAPSAAATLQSDAPPEGLAGAGLAIVLKVGIAGAAILLPESSGLLPDWYAEPDATGESKLATLAQELGMNVLPADFMPDGFRAARVESLSEALARGGPDASAGLIPFDLAAGETGATAWMVWPLANPDDVLAADPSTEGDSLDAPVDQRQAAAKEAAPAEEIVDRDVEKLLASTPRRGRFLGDDYAHHLDKLPLYARSLLKIKVPVTVTLAATKQRISEVVELGLGSIIQFEKSCEETLDLEVSNQTVGVGEAVKVGDKFGLRITSMILPEERFATVRPAANS